ncbi:PREDICTED: DUF724 domain-containing protein 3-like isoform X2 [Camelina sativa]|nr:PREDICTED: DUF724 domain-containing protein 3-like isoform X2 [Camelina sativa]
MRSCSAAAVEETPAKPTVPFPKLMPFWDKYETEEVYKTLPQNPHFSPLVDAIENAQDREMLAVGMILTFYDMLKEVKNLPPNVSSSQLRSIRSYFAKVEKHGFDVAAPLSLIDKALSLQDGREKKVEKRECLDKKIEAKKTETRNFREELGKFEEELVEFKRKIMELETQKALAKEEMEAVKEKEEAADKMIDEMRSCVETIDQEIADGEVEFITSLLAPW